ncbi:MAG: helicase, partial [Myxococcaceae bacterium]|nr:helicase [Myxococcaceae bacterium]
PEYLTLLFALTALDKFLSKGEPPLWSDEALAIDDEGPAWAELVLWLLVMRFTGTKVPSAVMPGITAMKKTATAAGFVWLAEELKRLTVSPPSGLSLMYATEEPWQRALRALEGAIELANGSVETGPEESSERLVWTLVAEADGSHQLTARMQTRTANGFTSGRQISLKKLNEDDPDASFLGADDRRVLRHIQLVRDYGWQGQTSHVLADEAPIALIGHPRVFADPEARVPVAVVRGEVRIDVLEQEGEVVVTLEPAACLERALVARYDGGARIVIYALTAEQRIVAQQLSREGLRLPAAARASAQRILGRLVSQFSLSSEIALETPHIEEVAPDARIHLQLRRAGTGLRIRCCVAPLGVAPTFPAGVGSANVLGTRSTPEGTLTVRCTRDLQAELLSLERLWAACTTLSEFDSSASELRIEELTRCLDLLCELRALGDAIVVEWPDGQAFSIVAERDLKDMKLKLRDQATWLQAEGELQIDHDLKLSFRQLLEHARARQGRFVALDDGRFVALSEALQRSLDGALALSRVRGDQLELHPLALLGVTSLSEALLDSDPQIAARLQRAREAALLNPEVPHTLEASLRPYQREGYAFLSRLAHWGAGACLADDMGLGKTLQTLALLVEQAPRGPSLVVAPTSVCANWLEEARKFAPSLRVVQLRNAAREQTLRELAPFDVLVCSYGVLQQERERLTATRFQVVVLDEAQAIKNASTNRAKTAMELVSNVRIALTGTPIENHLGELWSILSFVNPGLLGSSKNFEERFVRPIQRDGDRQAAQLLRRIISPFVLRRRKSEVLDDLPEKTVVTLRVEPSTEERTLFAALREQAVARMATSDKPAEARIRLLAELTRMRRAACHPDLVMPGAGIPSSKLATLEALLLELRDGGHRVLVFSQFVDYLTIVRARLEAIGITYQYLDGSSTTPARAASVTAFQAGESDVFLISLRAGGFGLNLTAADYVIHLDPWWNPAVEDQASDRAHRIGQTRPVTIYRLVMEGSIEEKILALHAVKRELADDLLAGTGTGQVLGVDELMDLLSEANAELSGPSAARSAE